MAAFELSLALFQMGLAFSQLSNASFEPQGAALGGAEIVCEEPEHDFGVVWTGDKLCHTFVLANVGTEAAFVLAYPCTASNEKRYFLIHPQAEVALADCVRSRRLHGYFEKDWKVKLLPIPETISQVSSSVADPSIRATGTAQLPTESTVERVGLPLDLVSTSRDGATIICEQPEYDIGTIWASEKLCHTFHIKNVGTATAYVRAAPGYSGIGFDTYFEIVPGGVFPFEQCLNPKKLHGRFEKLITIDLHSPPDADTTCCICRRDYDDAYHLDHCGPVCRAWDRRPNR